ncbi:MFS transporter permease [Microbacterium mangrovi]|uniref:MFS transporter permease n=1 Tax=Microbacterium mangrovi TaxID=1348253 RepID=UPI000ADB6C37|nr:MFS transporter permease [Microbacterium mangrovi]
MWLRRAFYGWLFPAAFILPLWLFIGWGVFSAGGWAFLWVVLIAIPSVFIGQLILTLMVRARPSARSARAVSWWDVLGFTVWHCLTISLAFFAASWWLPVMILTVCVGLGMFWLEIWQLMREAVRIMPGSSAGGAASTGRRGDVFVITETDSSQR